MRGAIAALPDGTYASELKTDGLLDTPITIRLALTVAGDAITADFTAPMRRWTARSLRALLTLAMVMYG